MSPSLNHSYLCKKIIVAIEQSEQWEAWPELALDVEGVLVPDIAIYRKGLIKPDFTEDKIRCEVLPQLVIEIVSPSQAVHDLMLKARKFLAAGIPAVWTVEPYGAVIYISKENETKAVIAELVKTKDVELDFAEIFKQND